RRTARGPRVRRDRSGRWGSGGLAWWPFISGGIRSFRFWNARAAARVTRWGAVLPGGGTAARRAGSDRGRALTSRPASAFYRSSAAAAPRASGGHSHGRRRDDDDCGYAGGGRDGAASRDGGGGAGGGGRRAGGAGRAAGDPAAVHAGADHGPDVRRAAGGRGAGQRARRGEHGDVPDRCGRGAADLLERCLLSAVAAGPDGWLPHELPDRGVAHGPARGARLGPALRH